MSVSSRQTGELPVMLKHITVKFLLILVIVYRNLVRSNSCLHPGSPLVAPVALLQRNWNVHCESTNKTEVTHTDFKPSKQTTSEYVGREKTTHDQHTHTHTPS